MWAASGTERQLGTGACWSTILLPLAKAHEVCPMHNVWSVLQVYTS